MVIKQGSQPQKSCQLCDEKRESSGRHHARAMTVTDLTKLLKHLDSPQCPFHPTAKLWSRALLTLGFYGMFRSEELGLFHIQDFEWDLLSKGLVPYINVIVRKRKTSAAGDGPQAYYVYAPVNNAEGEISPYNPLKEYWAEYQKVLNEHETVRDSNPLMFPEVDLFNGAISLMMPINSTSLTNLIKKLCESTVISDSFRNYRYTSHCLRRGGAQYRLFEAPVFRLDLRGLKLWGGWAVNEADDTIIKYVLDEYHAYENNISDFFDPHRTIRRHQMLYGIESDVHAPLSTTEHLTSLDARLVALSWIPVGCFFHRNLTYLVITHHEVCPDLKSL